MRVSVIIPTVNRQETLVRLLEYLGEQTLTPDEIIVVEQGEILWKQDNIPHKLRASFYPVYTHRKSLSAARDTGRRIASGDFLFFFDDDILLPMNYLQEAVHYLHSNSDCLAVGGRYVDEIICERKSLIIGRILGIYGNGSSNKLLSSGWGDYVRGKYASSITRAEWLFGCNFAVRSTVFEKAFFETNLERWSFLEDLFFGLSLRQAYGDCIRLLPSLTVTHAPTQSSGEISPMSIRMRILYRYILWHKYLDDGSKMRLIHFITGMFAKFILILKQKPRLWVLGEQLYTFKFLMKNRELTIKDANDFIFS